MKPKYNLLRRSVLPALIVIPMMQLASADPIPPDMNGNVTVTPADSGNNNIIIPNGQPAGQNTILFQPGTNLTPTLPPATAISILVEQATGATYLIDNNAGASITGGAAFDGISTTGAANPSNLIVQNNGVISGDNNGISTTGALDLTNDTNGVVRGAIGVFAGNGLILTNASNITGDTNSILGSAADDMLTLNPGSRIIGDINGVSGNDNIIFNGGLTQPGGIGNSITGDVTNFDTIVKNGGGVAFIGLSDEQPSLVNADTITINGGPLSGSGLYINGDLFAQDGIGKSIINSNGAALGGTGTWNSDVFINTGGISAGSIPINLDGTPANSVGTLAINGNVDHAFNSFIRFDVNPNTPVSNGINSDLITHTGGTYRLDGANVRISSTDNNQFIRSGEYIIINSDSPITGGFGAISVQMNPNVNAADTGFIGSEIDPTSTVVSNNPNTVLANNFSRLSLSPDNSNLLLTVNRDFSGLPGLSPNAAAFGAALDASAAAGTALDQDFIAALDNSNLAVVQATLAGANADSTFAVSSALVSSNYRLNGMVREHLALTRMNDGTMKTYVGSYSDTVQQAAPQSEVYNSSRGNVWGAYSHTWRESEGFGPGGNIDGDESAFTAGFDYRVSPAFLIGLVLDGSTAEYDYNGGGSSDIDSFRAAIYGTYGQSTGFYLDFLAGYGTHEIDLRNNAGILGGINSNTDAESIQAMLTVGYAMQAGGVKHGPFGGIEYQNVDVDGYNQIGGPLAVGGYEIDSLRLLAGYRVEGAFGKFSPYASVAYAHEFEDDNINTRATLPGGTGFGVTGRGQQSAILISAGANYAITPALSLTLGYLGEITVEDDGTDSHGANIGLNYAF